jgi:DnaJ-class molecular chaperone
MSNVIDLLTRPCPRCRGGGEVASNEVDEDGDERPPVGCPRCGGSGHALAGMSRPGFVRASQTTKAKSGR